METGLKNRRAIITGGSHGLGRAIADGLAAEGVGLALLARGKDELERAAAEIRAAYNVPVLTLVADITSGDEVRAAAARLEADPAFGTVNILVNNAGMAIGMQEPPQIEWTDEKWLAHIQVKQLGALRMIRDFRRLMPSDGTGRVITITGASGSAVTARALIVGMNNAALDQMTRYVADELAEASITVNAVTPGVLASPDRMKALEGIAAGKGIPVSAIVADLSKRTGVVSRRFGELSEVVDSVIFLSSDRASYITGSQIRVDGGLSINARRLYD